MSSRLTSVEDYAKEFEPQLDPPCSVKYERFLVQLGLPGPDHLTLWYALPWRPGDAGPRADLRPSIESLQLRQGERWSPLEVGPLVFVEGGGKGRIEVRGLEPGRRYRVKVRLEKEVVDLEAGTAPAADSTGGFRFVAWSCLEPYGYKCPQDDPFIPLRTANSLRLLERRATAKRASETRPDFALALGDQVYVDENAHRRGKRALLVGTTSDEQRYQGDARPYLEVAYRRTLGIPPLDEAFRNLPHVMMWDDHEIRDGWGSRGDEYDQRGHAGRWQQHLLATREQFRDFQALRNPLPLQLGKLPGGPVGEARGDWNQARLEAFMKPEPVAETEPEPRRNEPARQREVHFQFDWGKSSTFFVMDLRSRRELSAPGGAQVISEAQFHDLGEWLGSVHPDTPMLFVLGSPLPLFHEQGWSAWLEEHLPYLRKIRADDVRDNWWWKENRDQRDRLLKMVADHFERTPKHRLLVLSGDCHFSEVLELRWKRGEQSSGTREVFGHEVVTSGLALANYYRQQLSFSQQPQIFADRITARGFGRFRGPCFAELVVTPAADPARPPEVAVTFVPATTVYGFRLANTAKVTEYELHLPVGPETAAGQSCECREQGMAAGGQSSAPRGCLSEVRTRNGWSFFKRFTEDDFRNERATWAAPGWRGEITYQEVIDQERAEVELRRKALGRQPPRPDDPDLFGVALSGGGVRSAALSFGFLRELDRRQLLVQADYLSTVSGGGYAGGHLQAAMVERARARQSGSGSGTAAGAEVARNAAQAPLLSDETLQSLSGCGRYLAPGKRMRAFLQLATLVSSYVMSLPATMLPLLTIVIALGLVGQTAAGRWPMLNDVSTVTPHSAFLLVVLLVAFRFVIPNLPVGRETRRWLAYLDTAAVAAVLMCAVITASVWLAALPTKLVQQLLASLAATVEATHLLPAMASSLKQLAVQAGTHAEYVGPITAIVVAVAIGFLADANALSMHGIFSDRILQAFLVPASRHDESLRLADLSASKQPGLVGPYPLINGCLNLLGERDNAFAGARASDYFLFSPLYCGAKLTGYASTRWLRYRQFSLAKAVAVSAASISPGMGTASSTVFSLVASLFNWRLGIWMTNPRRPPHWFPYFWPAYGFLELSNLTSSKRRLLNVSDGGFIDNLGVIELLRRRCKVILALDNTHDPAYDFHYLQNLVIRARQEMGVHIHLPEDAESTMRPSVIRGMSRKQFVLAPITLAADRPGPAYRGLFIYAKATLSEERDSFEGRSARTKARAYKKFHPSFPQESTFDQFFDDSQWEAYYELGQEIAEEVMRDPQVLGAVTALGSDGGAPMAKLADLLAQQPRGGDGGEQSRRRRTPPGSPLPPVSIPLGIDDPTPGPGMVS